MEMNRVTIKELNNANDELDNDLHNSKGTIEHLEEEVFNIHSHLLILLYILLLLELTCPIFYVMTKHEKVPLIHTLYSPSKQMTSF